MFVQFDAKAVQGSCNSRLLFGLSCSMKHRAKSAKGCLELVFLNKFDSNSSSLLGFTELSKLSAIPPSDQDVLTRYSVHSLLPRGGILHEV